MDSRPKSEYALLLLLVFQGVSALYGGAALVWDPTGGLLGMPPALLDESPFETFLLPGLLLFSMLGVFPLVAFWGVWRESLWALPASLVVGLGLLIWLAVQIALIGYQPDPPLQALYGVVGSLIVISAVLVRSARNPEKKIE